MGRIKQKGVFMKSAELLSLRINIGKRAELFLSVKELFKVGGRVATVNPIMMSLADRDKTFFSVLKDFELKIPDGVGISRELSRRGIKTDTLPGVELGKMLLDCENVRLFLFGGKDGIARAAAENLKGEFPKALIVGTECGYGYEIKELKEKIKESRANLVFVCLGTPVQELIIDKLFKEKSDALYIGLGGSLDIYSNTKKRAPRIFRSLKLEWLFRILKEPARISKIPDVFYFVKKAKKERKKLQKKQKSES